MHRLLFTLAFFVVTLYSIASSQPQLVGTTPASPATYYATLTFLTAGETQWLEHPQSDEVAGFAYRVLIATNEIYSSMYFEKISLGVEGCCVKVVWARKLDKSVLISRFHLEGELTGIEFVRWRSPTSFEFTLKNHTYLVTHIDRPRVLIELR